MSDHRPGVRRGIRVFRVVLVVVLATFMACEILIRIVNPLPPLQIIRTAKVEWFEEGGIPVWLETRARMNLDCLEKFPDAENVVFSGDSIFYGTGVKTGDEFTAILQARLDSRYGEGRWCVLNLSQPAYSIEQKEYWLRHVMERYRIHRVFWEIWPNEINRFRVFGQAIYNFGDTDAESGRLPSAIPGPRPLTEWMFKHSRFFEFTALAMLDTGLLFSDSCDTGYLSRLDAIRDAVEQGGGTFTAVPATMLDRPFEGRDVNAEERDEGSGDISGYARNNVEDYCDFRDFMILRLGDMFLESGVSHLDVRVDECCHFNDRGHEMLSGMFFDKLASTEASEPDAVRTVDR